MVTRADCSRWWDEHSKLAQTQAPGRVEFPKSWQAAWDVKADDILSIAATVPVAKPPAEPWDLISPRQLKDSILEKISAYKKPTYEFVPTFTITFGDPSWVDSLKTILSKFAVKNFRIPITLQYAPWYSVPGPPAKHWGVILLSADCLDRTNGQSVKVHTPWRIPDVINEATITTAVREAMHYFVAHEIDECLMFSDERRWDPHANGPTYQNILPYQLP